MSSSNIPPVPVARQPPKPRKCGACRGFGHNRRTCPVVPPAPVAAVVPEPQIERNPVAVATPPVPFAITAVPNVVEINLERVVYVVFDLETTGTRRRTDEIIEIAAVFLTHLGIPIEDATFDQLVKPKISIPPHITTITSISDDHVADADPFPIVAEAFIRFLVDTAAENPVDDNTPVDFIILVGHNARVFDVPFFFINWTNMAC